MLYSWRAIRDVFIFLFLAILAWIDEFDPVLLAISICTFYLIREITEVYVDIQRLRHRGDLYGNGNIPMRVRLSWKPAG